MVSFPSFKLCFKNFSNMKLINESSNNRWLYFIRENKQKNITALVFEYNRIEFDFFENKYLKMKKKISIPHFSPHFHIYHRKSIYIIADITCVFSNLISYAISLFLIFVLFRTIGSLWPRSYHGRCIIRGKVTSLSLSLKLNFRNWNGKWTIRISNELPRKTLYFFFFFERFCIYLVVQLSPIPLHFPLDCTVQDRETFTPEYDAEVQFNFAIIAELRMNSNKSYEAVRCQLTCNFVLPYWTSSAKTAFEEKEHEGLLAVRTHNRYERNLLVSGESVWD